MKKERQSIHARDGRAPLSATGELPYLTSDKISDIIWTVESTVTELLREFPRVRRAVFAGETVIIKSREGNMRLTLDTPAQGSLVGCMKGLLSAAEDDIDRPTSDNRRWDSHL